ncbi:MAG: hypothetical protein ACFFCS_10170 [Candidatus Hodarchaeota archaeon]
MKKGTSQLTLDYFSGQLKNIKNNIKEGKEDPLLPLKDYIDAFNQLKIKKDTKLTDSIDVFHSLCDIFDYKVSAFKSLLYSISSDKIQSFLDDDECLEKIVDIIPWVSTVDLVRMSNQFLSHILVMMEKERKELPSCVIDDYNKQEIEFILHIEDKLFSEQKKAIIKEISSVLSEKSSKMNINEIIGLLDEKMKLGKVRIFVILLHLIQDGNLELTGTAEKAVSKNNMVALS